MTTQRWKILDADEDLQSGPLHLDASHVAGAPAGFSVRHIIHRGGLSAGVDELRIHNGRLAFAVLPTRGMGIWKAWWDDRLEIGWRSPVRGPVHPRFVPVAEPSGLGWLDGFDELLCRCGASSNGAPDFDAQGRLLYPLHGRIANRPAQRVEIAIEGDQITVTGVVQEVRFHFAKLQLTTRITTHFDQPSLQIDDQVQNLSASAGEMQMLYHINFGVPLLGAGAQLVAPVDTVVPRTPWAAESIDEWLTYEAPRPGRAERVYFCRLRAADSGDTRVLLKDRPSTRGVSLAWNVHQLPCFTLWKNETAIDDGYVTGLEPGTNFPNPRSYEAQHGRVVKLGAGKSYDIRLVLSVLDCEAAVAAAEADVAALQGSTPPTVHRTPQAGWCS